MWMIFRPLIGLATRPLFPDSALHCGQNEYGISRLFGVIARQDSELNRDFLVQLWVADRKLKSSEGKRKVNVSQPWVGFPNSFGKFIDTSTMKAVASPRRLKSAAWLQPSESFSPRSPAETRIASLLARWNLLITRDVEWANLMLGFEQESRYAIVDVSCPHSPVGFIHEKSNLIARQLLRLRRPFVAYIYDATGDELFRIRRPFWWITSSIYAEIDGKEIGVVHRRWHLWKRIYDLYLGNQQFAVVENPGFWNWTFTLKDMDGGVLAEIDRNWRGFGFEIFTDAGQYVIRFGSTDGSSVSQPYTFDVLEVKRSLDLLERAVTLTLAVSLDNDYFSRHGGWGIPFVAVED